MHSEHREIYTIAVFARCTMGNVVPGLFQSLAVKYTHSITYSVEVMHLVINEVLNDVCLFVIQAMYTHIFILRSVVWFNVKKKVIQL